MKNASGIPCEAGVHEAFVPTGRPVVRFVSVLGALMAVLAAFSWSGAASPHVAVQLVEESFDNPRQSGTVVVVVTNRGPAAAYVDRITSGNRSVHVVASRGAGGRRVSGGAAVRVTFAFTFDCAGFAPLPVLDIRVRVRALVGLTRSIFVDSRPEDAMCFAGRPNPPLP